MIKNDADSKKRLIRLEQYYFHRLYSIDLDSARHALRVLRRYRRKDVRYCLLGHVVVTYIRPFSSNKGIRISNHALNEKVVPTGMRSLHRELKNSRDKQFAHTDYEYSRPKAVDWSSPQGKWFPMSFRGYDYAQLDTRVPEIERLVEAVERNLKGRIDAAHDELSQLLKDAKEEQVLKITALRDLDA